MRLRSAARVEAKGWQREWKETEQDKDLVKKKELVKDRKEECRTPNKNNHQTSGTNEERNEQEAKTPVLKNIQKCKESEEGEPCTPVQDTVHDLPPTPVAPKKAPARTKKRPGDFLMSARRLVFTDSNLKKFNDMPSNFPKVKSARH
mmetsp:Transcript_11554/g.71072  ORF Transcript_11554/g.71072 Transcript_11554/m.71072 type:complete len:147 (+) Transcript_11554:399-839(+)